MKKLILATTAFAFMSASTAFAATAAKTYPIVGQVLEITSSKIVVQAANKRKWEIVRESSTKVPSDVKVGSIIVVQTTLTASEVVDKTPKAAKAAAAAKAESKTEKK